MNKIGSFILLLAILLPQQVLSQEKELANKFDQYIRPYVETNNFSGRILISRKGKVLFNKAYGLANIEFGVPNDLNTVFHLASLSKTFTAAAILILEQKGLLDTDDPLSKFIPDYPSGNTITLHHLLSHTSGITEVNDLPEYDNASLQPQTPETLVELFKHKPLEFRPGEKYQYSNSNYSLLALIIERVSKMKFGDFLKENIFLPLRMDQTYHAGNMAQLITHLAEGYSCDGNFGMQKPTYLDWSSKTGSGSLAATADDLAKWNDALFGTSILSEKSKTKMFTKYAESGYGWYLGNQYDKPYIFMNGRAPGFCTHMGRYPEDEIFIIVLSNVQVFTPKLIAMDLAGILFDQPVETPHLTRKLTTEETTPLIGKYKFGKDFYKPNFTIEVTTRDGKLTSNYGELIPAGKPLQFFQRSYWLKVLFTKDAAGNINGMMVDGFRGEKSD
jgi:CubicO group peptidase (beta-lactamase class C family)